MRKCTDQPGSIAVDPRYRTLIECILAIVQVVHTDNVRVMELLAETELELRLRDVLRQHELLVDDLDGEALLRAEVYALVHCGLLALAELAAELVPRAKSKLIATQYRVAEQPAAPFAARRIIRKQNANRWCLAARRRVESLLQPFGMVCTRWRERVRLVASERFQTS